MKIKVLNKSIKKEAMVKGFRGTANGTATFYTLIYLDNSLPDLNVPAAHVEVLSIEGWVREEDFGEQK